jgi:glutamate synthase (NADPH/NADH) large chain
VKLVAEIGVGTVAAGVAKAHSDVILISGHDGGTGASPLTSIKYAGTPWELGLAETQQTLVLNNLRDRVRVQTDGQLKTGRDVAIAALLGAEEYGFATAPLVVMGCIMMRVCHLDTCPVGVATQNPDLRARFTGQAQHVVNFFRFIAEELREIMAQLGFRKLDDMIGRSDLLDMRKAIAHYKAKGLDFSKILYRPEVGPDVAVRRMREQDHGIADVLDQELLRNPQIRAILDTPYQVRWCPAVQDDRGFAEIASASDVPIPSAEISMPIQNVHRAVGAIMGSEITRKFGHDGLPEDRVRLKFTGSAGQSFGAFAPRGVTLTLEGDSNDYCGKGLSGGKIAVFPHRDAPFVPEDNILIGNVALYGGTGGRAFFRGRAGERFAVRNSGVHTVVEGTGDHCCEYMTGGIVVTIGRTGRNFGAGMSGGMAFVLDDEGDFPIRLNTEMVELEPFDDPEDHTLVHELLEQHLAYTGSTVARRILENWEAYKSKFHKVMPVDYKRVLQEQRKRQLEAVGGGTLAAAE